MLFSSPIFLFAFFPFTVFAYFVFGHWLFKSTNAKNWVLLTCSLLFYAWGEGIYLALLLVSIFGNYLFGLKLQSNQKKLFLIFAILFNLTLLSYYKYANFIAENLNGLFESIGIGLINLEPVHLPLGISFFTFQAISYLIDVYRGETPPQKSPLKLALYISLFPQLIAGPIVRYQTIAKALDGREESSHLRWSGLRRFSMGMGKKVLIANPLAEVADLIFALPEGELSTSLAWIGIICYTLQIYFDFSAYSDMAIGLGRILGFKFLENFNYPYISTSIREFWRRWHISLSTWFRDYLYIPLGGNRLSTVKTARNLFLVFLLCGLWHGAAWNYIVWGLIHGAFLSLERTRIGEFLDRSWQPIKHFYVILVVMIAWVFFRAETLGQATSYLQHMFIPTQSPTEAIHFASIFDNRLILPFFMAVILSTQLYPYCSKLLLSSTKNHKALILSLQAAMIFTLLLCSAAFLASDSYNPFIYFRF